MAHLVMATALQTGGRGFDSGCTNTGVDLSSNRNDQQCYFLGVKTACA